LNSALNVLLFIDNHPAFFFFILSGSLSLRNIFVEFS